MGKTIARFQVAEFLWDDITFCGRQVRYTRGPGGTGRIRATKSSHNQGIETAKLPYDRRRESQRIPALEPHEKPDLASVVGTLQRVGSNTTPPIQAAVFLAQSDTSTVDVFLFVISLLREVRDEYGRARHLVHSLR